MKAKAFYWIGGFVTGVWLILVPSWAVGYFLMGCAGCWAPAMLFSVLGWLVLRYCRKRIIELEAEE